jgi:hypothetical protein
MRPCQPSMMIQNRIITISPSARPKNRGVVLRYVSTAAEARNQHLAQPTQKNREPYLLHCPGQTNRNPMGWSGNHSRRLRASISP